MVEQAEKTLTVGRYRTRSGREARVDAVADGMLIGRYLFADEGIEVWIPKIWTLSGASHKGLEDQNDIGGESCIPVKREYWVNIYQEGPGLLRKSWEECLIETSRDQAQPLCRVRLPIDSYVGEGLK